MAGVDQEQPGEDFLGMQPITDGLGNGTLTQARVDDSVLRILTPLLSVGAMDRKPNASRTLNANATSAAHNTLARNLAAASIVLLKNDNPAAADSSEATVQRSEPALPLDPASVKHIALFGQEAIHWMGRQPTICGVGSGGESPPYVISPMQGILAALKFPCAHTQCIASAPNNCSEAQWLVDTEFKGRSMTAKQYVATPADCCAVCAATPACQYWSLTKPNGSCWMKPNEGAGPVVAKGWVSGNCYASHAAPDPKHPPPIKACSEDGSVCVSWTPPNASAVEIASVIKDSVSAAFQTGGARGTFYRQFAFIWIVRSHCMLASYCIAGCGDRVWRNLIWRISRQE